MSINKDDIFAQIPYYFLWLAEFPANKIHGFAGEKTGIYTY